jgi:transcriptional regulator with XRE-family HTH domain
MTMGVEALVAGVRARKELPSPEMCRAIRVTAGSSLRSVAAALGVSPQAVTFWEQGRRRPKDSNLVAYADLLRELQEVGK